MHNIFWETTVFAFVRKDLVSFDAANCTLAILKSICFAYVRKVFVNFDFVHYLLKIIKKHMFAYVCTVLAS